MTNSIPTHLPTVAIVGSGYWGKNLVRNFYQLRALKLICDKNEALLARFEEEYHDVETRIDFNDVISREDIHAVVIATPSDTHFTLAQDALFAGKHVFVEKPLALWEEEGQELIASAGERNRVLMVGHLLQYHPAFVRLKEMATLGELGRINYIYSHRLNLGKIRREENILWSFAPHDISMILSLAKEEPESVIATGGNYLHQKIADVTTTNLEFPSGLRAHIFVSWLHPFKEQKLVVVGDHKMAVFDDTQPWADKLLIYPHEIKWRNNVPLLTEAEPERLSIPQAEPLHLECQHFLDCISRNQRPITDGDEGLKVLKVLNACQRSLDECGCRVSIQKRSGRPQSTGLKSPRPAMLNSQSDPDQANVFIHETAIVDDKVFIGTGSNIWHFSHILPGTRIGDQCNIGQNVVIGPEVIIGNRCKIQDNVSVYKGVTLEDEIFCGPSVVFTNVYNPRASIRRMDQLRPTLVRKGATIGANATIVCGINIGRYAFIGAGSVVNKDVMDYALMVGNPAHQIGWICECGVKLNADLLCDACGKRYFRTQDEFNSIAPTF